MAFNPANCGAEPAGTRLTRTEEPLSQISHIFLRAD
jgi:hypothetical protein